MYESLVPKGTGAAQLERLKIWGLKMGELHAPTALEHSSLNDPSLSRSWLSWRQPASIQSTPLLPIAPLNVPLEFQASVTKCGGLNEKCPRTLRHLDTWSPVGGTIWGDYGTFMR